MTTSDERTDEPYRDLSTTTENLSDADEDREPIDRSSADVATEDPDDGVQLEATRDPGRVSASDTLAPEAPLFLDDQRSSYRERWDEIQARFVDDPRRAVQDADELVSNVVTELETSFRTRREALEGGWQRGDDVSTEDLRLALQGYRSFFGRLLGD